jgi:DNA-binding response OmpR family regulator
MPATILIADDHESSRTGLEALLSLEGYNVLTAEDGIQALEQFRRTQPDLLLLDINMPNMRGTEVCRRIKNNPETLLVPLVRITGLTATEDRVTGIQAGADFLCKPVNREQLIARVRSPLPTNWSGLKRCCLRWHAA